METAPHVIRSGLSLAQAEGIRAQFEAIGARVDIMGSLASIGAAGAPAAFNGLPTERPSTEQPTAAHLCSGCGKPIHRLDGSCTHCQTEEVVDRPVPAWLWAGVALLLVAGTAAYLSPDRSAPAPTQALEKPAASAEVVAPQTPPPVRTIIAEVTLQSGLLGPFEISGATNLPEGTFLPIWLEGDYPACTPNCGFEMEQATVRNGRFRVTVKGQDPPPGRYTVYVTTAQASSQPPNVGAMLGPSGNNLRGAYIAVLSDGGKYHPIDPERSDARAYISGFLVHYTQRIEIGEGGAVIVCPKRNMADDCEQPSQTSGVGSETPPKASEVQPTN